MRTLGLFDSVKPLSNKDIIEPFVVLCCTGLSSDNLRRVRRVIFGPAFGIRAIVIAAIDEQIMGKYRALGITPDRLPDKDVVIDESGAVVHLQEDCRGFSLLDDIAGDSGTLIAIIHPNPECPSF